MRVTAHSCNLPQRISVCGSDVDMIITENVGFSRTFFMKHRKSWIFVFLCPKGGGKSWMGETSKGQLSARGRGLV